VVPFGLCEDYPEESRSIDEVRRDIALLKRAGVHLLRVSIGWDGVEPERDHYELAFWDAFMGEMAAAGIRIIPYVAYTPRWNAAGKGADYWKRPPVDLGQFTEIMGLLAARFRGRVGSWEIWNEPDNLDFWSGTEADYAALLIAGARGVKAGDPDAKVVLGGIAGHPEFAARVLATPGVAALVDIVNAHAYFETWNPSPLETLPRYVEAFSRALTQPPVPTSPTTMGGSGAARPLWLAEVGYSDYLGAKRPDAGRPLFSHAHTPAFQAVMLVRTVALALARPEVQLFAWYEVKDPAAGAAMIGDDNNRHLGVVFADRTPKPALGALALVTRLFGDGFRRLDGVMRVHGDRGSKAEVHAFINPARQAIVVAWLPTIVPERTVGGVQPRVEHIDLELPFSATGPALRLDAEGGVREQLELDGGSGGPSTSPAHLRIAGITLVGGEVAVVVIPLGPRGSGSVH
jgi:polysaccharide biosynthesis protein PslG